MNTTSNVELLPHLPATVSQSETLPQPPTAFRFRTRRGKVARLPRSIRETVNRRLRDGEIARPILAWLNAQPEVQTVLAEQFAGRPITDQNLSEWRHGGYVDWMQKDSLRESLHALGLTSTRI